MVLDDILKVFSEFGYDSINDYPYVYKGAEGLGVTYKYSDSKYGELVRVKICYRIEEVSSFLKLYKWFMDEGSSKGVYIVFDDYVTFDPKLLFYYDNVLLDDNQINNFDNYINNLSNVDDLSNCKKRTKEVIEVYKGIYSYVYNYIESYNKAIDVLRGNYITLQILIDRYNKNNNERDFGHLSFVKFKTNIIDDYDKFKELYNSQNDIVSYNNLFNKVIKKCLEIELNDDYLKCISLFDQLNKESDVVKKKIDFLNSLLIKNKFVDLNSKLNKYKVENSFFDVSIYRINIVNKYNNINYSNFRDLNSSLNNEKLITLDDMKQNYLAMDISLRDKLLIFNSLYSSIIKMIMKIDNFNYLDLRDLVIKLKSNENYDSLFDKLFNQVLRVYESSADEVLHRILGLISFESEFTFIKSILNIINDVKSSCFYTTDLIVMYMDDIYLDCSISVTDYVPFDNNCIGVCSTEIKGIYIGESLDIFGDAGVIKVVESSKFVIFKDMVNIYNKSNLIVSSYVALINKEANYSLVNSMKKECEYNYLDTSIYNSF